MTRRSQMKQLQVNAPRGAPLDSQMLERYGVSMALAYEYVKSGWLDKLGRGVFMFAGDQLTKDASLQYLETKIPGIHVAAKSALALHGFQQNIAFLDTTILWGSKRATLPEWFQERFPARYSNSPLFDPDLPTNFGLAPMPESPSSSLVSTPERALLEMLSEVGVHQEMEEARAIMEGIRQLRSRHLQKLLLHCRMVKAVRLCVGWATELELPWAIHAHEAVADHMGTSRWVARFKSGRTLIINPS